MRRLLPTVLLLAAPGGLLGAPGPWSVDRARAWYRQQPWLAGCNFLPVFREHRIGCWSWGRVAGRTQTYYPWGSPRDAPAPKVWQHDILRADGTAFSTAEVRFIRTTTARLPAAAPGKVDLSAIRSPIIFRGDATTAYRDPAVVYYDGWFRLFFTWPGRDAAERPAPARPAAGNSGLRSASEADARLHADGKGWRLDKARVLDPNRPRVLLIGDSILNGYLKNVIAALEGKAYVDGWVNPYHQSEYVNKLLADVLAQGPYDVVHFNMGLHGWQEGRIKTGTFEPLTKAYVQVLRTTLPNAKLIWASSTPVTVKGKPLELDPEINPVIVEHNRLAAAVMTEMHVPVNDFYSLLVPRLELARGDQFHWKPPAYQLLAKTVTASVLQALGADDSPAR